MGIGWGDVLGKLNPLNWGPMETISAALFANQAAGDPMGVSKPKLTEEQKKLLGAQTDFANVMSNQARMRGDLTLREENGQLVGPLADALNMAMGTARQAQATPRLRLQSRPFNPFGEQRNVQTFGPSMPQIDTTPLNLPAPVTSTSGGNTGGNQTTPPNLPPGGTEEDPYADFMEIINVLSQGPARGSDVTDAVTKLTEDLGGMWRETQGVLGGLGDTMQTAFSGIPGYIEAGLSGFSELPGQIKNELSVLNNIPGYIQSGLSGFSDLPQQLEGALGGIPGYIQEGLSGFNQVPDQITQAVSGIPGYIREGLSGFDQLPQELQAALGTIPGYIREGVGGFNDAAQSAFSGIPGYIQEGLSGFSDLPQQIQTVLAGAPGYIQEGLSGFSGLPAQIQSVLAGAPGYIQEGLAGFSGIPGQVQTALSDLGGAWRDLEPRLSQAVSGENLQALADTSGEAAARAAMAQMMGQWQGGVTDPLNTGGIASEPRWTQPDFTLPWEVNQSRTPTTGESVLGAVDWVSRYGLGNILNPTAGRTTSFEDIGNQQFPDDPNAAAAYTEFLSGMPKDTQTPAERDAYYRQWAKDNPDKALLINGQNIAASGVTDINRLLTDMLRRATDPNYAGSGTEYVRNVRDRGGITPAINTTTTSAPAMPAVVTQADAGGYSTAPVSTIPAMTQAEAGGYSTAPTTVSTTEAKIQADEAAPRINSTEDPRYTELQTLVKTGQMSKNQIADLYNRGKINNTTAFALMDLLA